MKRSWFQILIIAGLFGLLATLAVLQYNWVGKISEDERERLQRRVSTDTERFAEDFNREIQNAYYNFQTGGDIWGEKNWTEFNERYEFWRSKTAYPDLIKSFYYWNNQENPQLSIYDTEKREFVETEWSDELKKLQAKVAETKNLQPFQTENFVLVMPVQELRKTVNRIVIRREVEPPREINLPKKTGYLIIALDENVLKNKLLPDLVNKYFPEKDFNLAVRTAEERIVFQTQNVSGSDAAAKLFNLSPDNFIFFSNREAISRTRNVRETKSVILSKRTDQQTFSRVEAETLRAEAPDRNINSFRVEVPHNGMPRTAIFETANPSGEKDVWTLNVRHSAGSLEQYITNARQRNLAVGFSILALLAISIFMIFVSAQRAKLLARRQIEFVSSVSHEFRTPLAVIYSASENLADGVAKEEHQVSRYGNLIKNEGKKLSKMVEQILEFAGADSGKKKYDLREIDVSEVVEKAIDECQPFIDENNFIVEKEIAANLPKIVADKSALSQALQNLIANSIKYSNGNRRLNISARNGGGRIKISVEDNGIGISAKDLRHIFEPFYRSKTVVDEQIHGNGLGLSLVKQTVEAHGGKIAAESEPGKGSKFTITFKVQDLKFNTNKS